MRSIESARRWAAFWFLLAAVIAVVGAVELATHGQNGAGYLGVAVVIWLVAANRLARRLRGPTRGQLAADRLHRRIFGPPRD